MTELKTDYPPLIPEHGLHPHTLDSLKAMTVDRFPDSARRQALFGALTVYFELLEATGLQGFLWVDGSFMCNKPEPDDVDLVVAYEAECVDAMSEGALQVATNLLNTHYAKARFNLHVFGVASDDQEGLEFWLQKFGTQRDECTPKGLAELRINQ